MAPGNRLEFRHSRVQCVAEIDVAQRRVRIQGAVAAPESYLKMELIAAAPADCRTSYHGSGLPWPCRNMALDHTPSYVAIPADGQFAADFAYPGAFYENDAIAKIPPSVFVVLQPRDGPGNHQPPPEPVWVRLELPDDLPLRTLGYRNGPRLCSGAVGRATGPDYYHAKEEILGIPRSAEATMRAYAEAKTKMNIA